MAGDWREKEGRGGGKAKGSQWKHVGVEKVFERVS